METHHILICEDDADDRYLIKAAFNENGFNDHLHFVEDGVELLHYLFSIKKQTEEQQPLPKFILLDLNMPKKDGREVLKELKQHPDFQKIPIIIFSTTNSEHEMRRCYELGANSYVTKPNNFENFLKTIAAIRSYWIQTSNIPV